MAATDPPVVMNTTGRCDAYITANGQTVHSKSNAAENQQTLPTASKGDILIEIDETDDTQMESGNNSGSPTNSELLPEFNHTSFKDYTKRGRYVKFIVWPALYLNEGGPLLCKGVAQGTDR